MKTLKSYILWISLSFLPFSSQSQLKLWYKAPAERWAEALPIGNSKLGAMVYGGVDKEELQLNEETFWAGGPYRNDNPEANNNLEEVRQLIFSGKNLEAQDLIDKTFYTNSHGMPYLTLGSLVIHNQNTAKASDYYRELDLEKAIITTSYKVDQTKFSREVFASLVDPVIILRYTSDLSLIHI